jgi:cyclic beta-1,2-glucan synthetase
MRCWTALPPLQACPACASWRASTSGWPPLIHARLDHENVLARRTWLTDLLPSRCWPGRPARWRSWTTTFLFDASRHLLSIGYNVQERRLDASCYDLLASEARLASFVGIAQGALPKESWFALGRLLTRAGGEPVLLSWSGSMFEYLMPQLVMPTYERTLLDQTAKAAVARQIEYGRQRGVPWGMSESAYNTVDAQLNYQYRAFGVPGLGLKRGLAEDLVVAPYASVMALMVAPAAACANLQRLAAEGFVGKFGFFEAIDYTPSRQRRGQQRAVVRAFMAHHQGMSLLALAWLVLDRPMQRRFESERLFQAVMPLLQERIPTCFGAVLPCGRAVGAAFPDHAPRNPAAARSIPRTRPRTRSPAALQRPLPRDADQCRRRLQPLARSGRDPLAGGHHLRQPGRLLLHPRCGQRGFLEHRLPAHAPPARGATRPSSPKGGPSSAVAMPSQDGGEIETYTEIVVSPEDDIELRRVRLTNRSRSAGRSRSPATPKW